MGGPFIALRTVQMDAELLDKMLVSWLQTKIDQILETTNYLHLYRQHFHGCIKPFYFLSHFLTGQSPGQQLLNIRSDFSNLKGLLNYMLRFLLPSIIAIMIKLLPSSDRQFQLWYSRAEMVYHLIDFIHFGFFLAHGGPMRLSEQMLGIATVYVQKPAVGFIKFASLNSELFGHSFVHLCFLLIPLFNVLKHRLSAFLKHYSQTEPHRNLAETASSQPGIVWCSECGQTAIGAVRARRKNKKKEAWKTSCHFCLFQSDAFGNGDHFQWEMLAFDHRK